MDEYIYALDIGSSKICGAAGKLEKTGRIQIVGVTTVPCIGLKKGIVVDIDSTASSINNCIEQLKRMIDREITKVFISLSGSMCELIPSRGVVAVSSEDREITKSDVKRVLNASRIVPIQNNKEIIGVIPKQFIIDGYDNIKDPVGMSGMKLEVESEVIVSQTTIVNNLLKSVHKAGLQVEGIVLESLAIAKAVTKKDENLINIAIIDVGFEKTDIAIYKNGNLKHTEGIPLGGNAITNDIAFCLKVPYSEAEKLKIKYGTMFNTNFDSNENIKVNISDNESIIVDRNTLMAIMEARIEEIFSLINNKLINNGFMDEIDVIILAGGGISEFNNISEACRIKINKPVRIGAPDFVGASNPIFNTAIGIIKDVYSTSNFKSFTESKEFDSEKPTKVNRNYNSDSSNEIKKNESVITKIKVFLADFF
ncbi:cell division protein FtsA [Candidatus Clostridium stratigraminis]|uniref:Cell division protein FtsA n=1 Tax=Candidatus Clostridium stratigraminis TaxID=3381661 RepID=A0ABW8T3X5_9CLOT